MECAARGRVATRCASGPPTRRCARCGAVAYCSISHQISHWNDHKGECARFAQQMICASTLNDFPFTFSRKTNFQSHPAESEKRCSFLMSEDLHGRGLWKFECCCGSSTTYSDDSWINNEWNLPSILCPCTEPKVPISTCLNSWKDYYLWRSLPLHSPVALLLHWPLTLYHCVQLIRSRISVQEDKKLYIHYLGPDRELGELAVFGELHALFPGVHLHIEFIGPAVPEFRDGERILLCSYACCSEDSCTCKASSGSLRGSSNASSSVTIQLRKGFYHDRYNDTLKVSPPQLIVAPNAGIAAYSSWLPTIEHIQQIGVPAIFSDFCEEAANLSACCIENVTGQALRLPVQVNPFRQPMRMEDSVLCIPSYSNCFVFGM